MTITLEDFEQFAKQKMSELDAASEGKYVHKLTYDMYRGTSTRFCISANRNSALREHLYESEHGYGHDIDSAARNLAAMLKFRDRQRAK